MASGVQQGPAAQVELEKRVRRVRQVRQVRLKEVPSGATGAIGAVPTTGADRCDRRRTGAMRATGATGGMTGANDPGGCATERGSSRVWSAGASGIDCGSLAAAVVIS